MTEVQTIIAQHPKAVALSFETFGYNGPVNEDTLSQMIAMYGEPYLEKLFNLVDSYDGGQTQNSFMFREQALRLTSNGSMFGIGGVLQPRSIYPDGESDPGVRYPIDQVFPMPDQLLPVDLLQQPGAMPSNPVAESLAGASQTSNPTTGLLQRGTNAYSDDSGMAVTKDGKLSSTDEDPDMNFLKRHKTAIIILVVVIILILLTRKGATTIVK